MAEWYYAIGGEQKGPVDEVGLATLAKQDVVRSDTLVWQEGMSGWQAYSTVATQVTAAAGDLSEVGELRRCAYSGQMLPESEMLQYGEHWVAVAHKAAFVASLHAGRQVGVEQAVVNQMDYVGFWWRVLAAIIDGLLVLVVMAVMAIPLWFIGQGSDFESGWFFALVGVALLLFVVLTVGYHTWMVGKYGGTLGKLALGFRVVNQDATKVSMLKAFGRYWAQIAHQMGLGMVGGVVGMIILMPVGLMAGSSGPSAEPSVLFFVAAFFAYVLQYGIGYGGYIWAAFHKQKASLHDLICSTRVVRA